MARPRKDLTGETCGLHKIVKFLRWKEIPSQRYRSPVYLAVDIFGGECEIDTHSRDSHSNFGWKFRNPSSIRKNKLLSNIYHTMHDRCCNPNTKGYDSWGGRGIKICPEWAREEKGWRSFRFWAVENGYTPGLSIDRKDVDKDYSPENCRWITRGENSRYRRETTLGEDQVKRIRQMYLRFPKKHGDRTAFCKIAGLLFETQPSVISHVLYERTWKGIY